MLKRYRHQAHDGVIERCNYPDGGNITHIVPKGDLVTPKQLALDSVNSNLYW